MELRYTEHAEENIKERELDKAVIEDVIRDPDRVEHGKFNRKIAQKMVGVKLLRVIYEKEGNVYIIITAYYADPERY